MIGVVVVNWNDTASSVSALRSATSAAGVVRVLVDNNSSEDPLPILAQALPDAVLVRRSANDGYAAGCNAGVQAAITAGASMILVLNNDATLAGGALDALVRAEEEAPGRILAPLIVYDNRRDTVWSAGGTVHLPMLRNHHIGLGDPVERHRQPHPVAWASGCALFFSASTWRRVGAMDEALFLYLEDVEWCLRARSAAVETWLIPEAVVHHEVSRTTATLPPEHVRYYAYRNLYRVAFRHAPGWAKPLVALELWWTLVKTALRWLAFPSYRVDRRYHARTRAIRDALLGRWGPVVEQEDRLRSRRAALTGPAR